MYIVDTLNDLLEVYLRRIYPLVHQELEMLIKDCKQCLIEEKSHDKSLSDSVWNILGIVINSMKAGFITKHTPPVYGEDSEFTQWNGLYFRSKPELSIAKELENRGISFLANAGGRFTLNGGRVTREPDFFVFINGVVAILEVDGAWFHPSAAKDHERDRIFQKLGIQVRRFPAEDCTKRPHWVVEEFLSSVL